MLSFHSLTLADQAWIHSCAFAAGTRSADFNFGNMFLWDLRYRQRVCRCGNRVAALACSGRHPIFPFPVGTGPLKELILAMRDYAAQNGFPFEIRGVEDEHIRLLNELFPGRFTITEDRDSSDYLYSADRLAALSGKKLHAKRNFINRFIQANDWSFRRMEKQDFPECLRLLHHWTEGEAAAGGSISGEKDAIIRALSHYEVLGLTGGVLFAGGKMAAFTIGERISEDTFDVHFEKADAGIDGAYPMINREFVRLILAECPEIRYINREDDMGLDNLRKSKLSYHPDFILLKHTAHWRE